MYLIWTKRCLPMDIYFIEMCFVLQHLNVSDMNETLFTNGYILKCALCCNIYVSDMNETLFTNGYIFYWNVLCVATFKCIWYERNVVYQWMDTYFIEMCFVLQHLNVSDMNETLFTNGYIFYWNVLCVATFKCIWYERNVVYQWIYILLKCALCCNI